MSSLFEIPSSSPRAWNWILTAMVLVVLSALSAFMTFLAAGVFVPGGELIETCGPVFTVVAALLAWLCIRRAKRIRGDNRARDKS